MNRGVAAIQLAALSNSRTYTGLLLIACGPLVEVAYLAFDMSGGDPLSYWNTYYFMFAIRSDMSTILYATGFFLLMPEFSRVKLAAIIPIAYKAAKIIFMAFVTNDAQYHQHVTASFLLYGVAAGLVWLFAFDWLMTLHFHKFWGCLQRAEKVLEMEGAFDHATARRVARKELQTAKSFAP